MKYVMNVCVVWDATAVQDHSAVGDMKDESLVITGVNTTAASMMRCYWGVLHWDRHGCFVWDG